MPTKNTSIFSNKDTRTWVQEDGVGEAFVLYGCHALTNWSRDYGETTYIKCKSPDEYGKKDIKETIQGDPDEPTFTVEAFTSQELDFLLGLDCPIDWQVHFGSCSSPSDFTGFVKIRQFYQSTKTSESESDVDYIGDEEDGEIRISVEFSSEDIVEIVQVSVTQSNNGVTEAQGFNDIAFLRTARCEGDCGAEIRACYWGVAVADSNYGVATANVWYTQDRGGTWTVCAVDPFSATDANLSSCVILPGTTAPRIIVFRGNVSGIYGARASISDDWGATWTEVDMGGVVDGSNVNGAYAYSSGLIFAVGNAGYMWYSEDRGASWTEVTGTTTGVSVELWDVHTPDGVNIFICGSDDTIITSSEGPDGAWSDITGPADGTENLYTIQSPTQYRLIVGGEVDAGTECLWISADGGTTWTASAFTGSTAGVVRRVRLSDKAKRNHYVMIHGTNNGATRRWGPGTSFYFHRTLDGGANWLRENLITNNGLNGLAVCNINRAFAAGETVGGIGEIQAMAP
jgi:hypothetical protein